MLFDKFTNIFFVLILLTLMLTVGWYSFNDYSSYIANQEELAQRSVESTAREIEILIENRKKSVRLFAHREQKLLSQLVKRPDNIDLQLLLKTRVDANFPDRLAVTVANQNGDLLLKRGKKLVGKTCRQDIRRYFSTKNNPSIHVHPSPGSPKLHIDILSDTSEFIQNKTVFFISFFLDDLFRTISHGQVVGHQLILVRTSTPELIETQDNETVTELIKLVGSLEKIPSVKRSEFRNVWSEKLNQHVLATTNITGTQWELRDIAKAGLLDLRRNELILQAAGIFMTFIIMTIAGLRLTKRLEVSRGNTDSVFVRIEEDRKRIAMDLHDQVLSDISHVQRECRQLIKNKETNENKIRLNDIECELDNITITIRQVIDDLHPHSLNLLGFSDTVRAYCNTHAQFYNKTDIRLVIHNWQDERLDGSDKLHLFRILQESVDNVFKHANASQCDVCLEMVERSMRLIINDNGTGINIQKNNLTMGHGIANIKERSRIIDAKVTWNVDKNTSGTNFILEKALLVQANTDENT